MDIQVLPTICTSLIVISAALVAIGWYHIRKGNRQTHMRYMIVAAVLALLFFLLYAARTAFVGNTDFGGPENLRKFYMTFLIFHITLATAGGVFGLVTLWLAFKQRFLKHKRIGRWTAVIWLLTAPTGVLVYVLLYMMYPGGHTKPVWDVIFNF
jgi:putative membrane protein